MQKINLRYLAKILEIRIENSSLEILKSPLTASFMCHIKSYLGPSIQSYRNLISLRIAFALFYAHFHCIVSIMHRYYLGPELDIKIDNPLQNEAVSNENQDNFKL